MTTVIRPGCAAGSKSIPRKENSSDGASRRLFCTPLIRVHTRAGFSLELELKSNEAGVIFDGMSPDDRGIRLSIIDGTCPARLSQADGNKPA